MIEYGYGYDMIYGMLINQSTNQSIMQLVTHHMSAESNIIEG